MAELGIDYKLISSASALTGFPREDIGGVNGLLLRMVKISIVGTMSTNVTIREESFKFFLSEMWDGICDHFSGDHQGIYKGPPELLKFTDISDCTSERIVGMCVNCLAVYVVRADEIDRAFEDCSNHTSPFSFQQNEEPLSYSNEWHGR